MSYKAYALFRQVSDSASCKSDSDLLIKSAAVSFISEAQRHRIGLCTRNSKKLMSIRAMEFQKP